MIKICRKNQKSVINKIYNNKFDNVIMSTSNLVDDIILSMYNQGIIECLTTSIKDKRAHNIVLPFDLILALSIAAKMKTKTSITDIPYAIEDHRVLTKLGYNIVDSHGDLKSGLMRESSLRHLLGMYNADELFSSYNITVQNYIFPKLNILPDIHILDCTELSVNLNNENYEQSGICVNKYGDVDRGYKLATIRGITKDTGLIEQICFGPMNIHDFKLSKDMLYTTSVLKPNDILINDRGFLDRELINFLKSKRGVDTYVPLKTNMLAYQMAVTVAQIDNNWKPHPTRKKQKISLVSGLGKYWESDNINNDVPFNACVVWDTVINDYFVFITTDITIDARQIILTYELRPEIEEDYRQLKDFWKLEDFKSTKLNMIAFHLITTLLGYLFFQIYTMTLDGQNYAHKSLPIILKNYKSEVMPHIIFYADDEFAILSIIDFAQIYTSCNKSAQNRLNYIFNK